MASFWFLLLLIIIMFMPSSPSPSLPSSSELISSSSSKTATNVLSEFSTDFPPYQVLSPDIAPLLPSPGGIVPTTGSTIPTIPSSPSPPNPDAFDSSLVPDSAPSPFSLPDSLAVKVNPAGFLNLAVFAGWVMLLRNAQYYSR
ncbi:classical arabinogalactan protein 27 [Carica papaya]|uniref:classical arabinogalactan protein 27 n=1 Tax=Carica papaya TaxID=3649 RepID=UPI000B8CE6A8|nr:classical arabinogalactan protein 27 [Carica papaya]